MTLRTPALHRTIVVVDVPGFTHQARNLPDRLDVRNGMYDVLNKAFTESGVDYDSCATEDRGDGMLILLPPDTAKSTVADRLPDRIVAALRRYNSTRIPQAQFQLRVGITSGDVLHDGNGWVGAAVDLAFRILDAPAAKAMLAESDRMVALISSEQFFTEVIEVDPGMVPESYRRIDVTVKTFSGTARLRLLGDRASLAPESPSPERMRIEPPGPVLELLPPAELNALRDCLTLVESPRLALIVSRAAGPAIPAPRQDEVRDAWEAFNYLRDFNAGPDGVPPAFAFLTLLVKEVDDVPADVAASVTAWLGDQTRRMRLGSAVEERRAAQAPLPDRPHLYLTIMLEPDPIDPERCTLAYWRQDDPEVWPPTLGTVREVLLDDVEFRVDDVILDAEGVWSGQSISAAVEFLLPRALLHLPVQRWHKEHASGQPRPLRYDYRISVRSLERMKARYWHRAWHLRFDSMLEDPSPDRIHYSVPTEEHPIDAVLSAERWVGLVLAEPPFSQREPGAPPDGLTAALRGGLPVVLWHPDATAEDLRELVTWLLDGARGFLELPDRRKMANTPFTVPFNDSLVRDLVVMWDDPKRVIVLDQPLIPTQQ
ncbi:VMAP-C domain-containing protein [Actinophytocola gossypii]|uniref:Guanylate cyclase domain-containing protein n=1 Tax=Actinophytocola gossypii TaxID=2812003 RepID=A0ABT2J8W3_9PSEU|nr:hypothetical protein [Actinophytocola gossypii]MCT2584307.1 hypothetical protein [Actinophytocola gossypii]